MASEQDDNPFARNSGWPRMPQAPFRVGPPPKAAPTAPRAETQPPPKTITPAFVRPLGPAAFPGPTGGEVLPRATPSPVAEVARAVPPVPPPAAEAAEAAAPQPQPYIEVAPVIVQPAATGARKARRKSPFPAIAATGVGLAAILGLAYALNRGQDVALKRAPPASAAFASVAPATPVAGAVESPVVAPAQSPTQAPVVPRRRVRTATPPKVALPTAAADESATAPLISLPPVVAAPAAPPAPLPSYTPPAAPDPNAPVSTRQPE